MPMGQVKWFSDAKGFGFITAPDIEGDVFVHFSAIVMPGCRTLAPDMGVEFELARTGKGYMAQMVRPAGHLIVESASMAAA